jgi:peptide deformylase
MALREIVTEGYESLSKICKPVTSFDSRLELLVKDMKDTLIKADGLGLAAPQIGVVRRIAIIIDGETDQMVTLINPEITAMSGVQTLQHVNRLPAPYFAYNDAGRSHTKRGF